MPKMFSWMVGLPYHLSVGAVVTNSNGEVLVHHWKNLPDLQNNEVFLLMRETPEENETLEQAVERGLAEEFGIKAEIKDYLGSIISNFHHGRTNESIEKTTTYFLCTNPIELPEGRTGDGVEISSKLEWHNPRDMIEISKAQAKACNSADLDESKMLLRTAILLEESREL